MTDIPNAHVWRQDGYVVGILDGLKYPCPVQSFRCENCNETIALPDCGRSMCRIIFTPGCTHQKTPKIIKRKEEYDGNDSKDMYGLSSAHQGKPPKQHHGMRGQRH